MVTAIFQIHFKKALHENVTPADKIKIFGCKAFAWIPDAKKKKIDTKTKKMVKVGYAPNGYRLWDMENKKVILARDIKFDETCYPFKAKEKQDVLPTTIKISHEQEGEDEEYSVVSEATDGSNTLENDEIVCSDSEEDSTSGSEHIIEERIQEGIRRSDRISKLPGKFFKYITGFKADKVHNNIPEIYTDIFNREDRLNWERAVEEELLSMDKYHVWDIVKTPSNAKLLQTKWVFLIKEDASGNKTKYKARLVVKGYLQEFGIDYWLFTRIRN